jgi:hypothetical protein
MVLRSSGERSRKRKGWVEMSMFLVSVLSDGLVDGMRNVVSR